jgi:hypothetical protein
MSEATQRRNGWQIARLVIAGLLAALGVGVILLTYLWQAAEVCEEQVATNGTVVEVCGPANDVGIPLIALWILLIVIVLLPDLSEFTVPGLVTIKRRVDEVARSTERLESAVTQLLQVNQNVGVHVNQNLFATNEDVRRFRETTETKLERPDGSARLAGDEALVDGIERGVSNDRALKEVQIIWIWERLHDLLTEYGVRGFPVGRARRGAPDVEAPSWIMSWVEDFYPQLQEARAIRNTVAHTPDDLDDEAISNAHLALRELYGSLRRRVDEMSARYHK